MLTLSLLTTFLCPLSPSINLQSPTLLQNKQTKLWIPLPLSLSLSFSETEQTTMDTYMYGSLSNPPDFSRIHDFPDFSHPLTAADSHHPPPQHSFTDQFSGDPSFFSNFPSVPSDEAAELEWLSHFVDDTTSFHDFPPSHVIPMGSHTTSFVANNNNDNGANNSGEKSNSYPNSVTGKSRSKREASPAVEGGVRRCSHCASEKTPQWRTGPLGPKTLCNACGVRFKSGRLVPEYRPAASPTFVLSQHSNSHRKVMELRRQKEVLRHQQQQQDQCYLHKQDFKVC